MAYQINFGILTPSGQAPAPQQGRKFRLAVLGDFSARANRGELETGDALAKRKPLKVEVDNIDDLLSRLAPKLSLTLPGSGAVELEFAEMQDFHPDALYEKLEVFSKLSSLRSRLKTTSTFAKAAKEMQEIGLAPAPAAPAPVATARGSVIAVDSTLNDFARFLGEPTADTEAAPDAKASFNAFLRGVVAPHITAKKDPQQAALVKAVDGSIGTVMRDVLHHPDFQTLEALWRSLAFLAQRLETDETLQIVLLDITAEELAADLSANADLAASALYRLLVEAPLEDEDEGPFSALVANYVFDRTPVHADLLGRMSKLCAAAQAPFLAAVPASTIDVKPDDVHPLTRDAWKALRATPEAAYLGLGLPRFMLRLPYGSNTDPIDSFDFEEFTMQQGLRALLWANPAVAVGLLLAQTFRKQGENLHPGAVSGLGELPYYCYEDKDGDTTALPCTERFITSRTQEGITAQGFLPLLAVKNSPEVRVGMFRSVGGNGALAGWWAPVPLSPQAAPAPAAQPAPSRVENAPAAAAPAGDAELDALLASLDTPAASAPPAAPAAAPAAENAPAGDADLDALLASLGGPTDQAPADAPVAAPPADAAPADAAPAGDPELDALLASLSEPPPPPPAADSGDMDPELAKLLADLS